MTATDFESVICERSSQFGMLWVDSVEPTRVGEGAGLSSWMTTVQYLTGSHHSTPISTQLCLQGFSRLYSFLSADTTDDPARWIRSTYIDPPKTGLQESVKTLSSQSTRWRLHLNIYDSWNNNRILLQRTLRNSCLVKSCRFYAVVNYRFGVHLPNYL